MPRHLLLSLEGPLLAFGGEVVDARGVVSDFPAMSMLTGLIANALGWHRGERDRLQRLQDRLVFAARIDREGERIIDNQNARIFEDDRAWTTLGRPEGREKSPSYTRDRTGRRALTHRRMRWYDADKCVTIALWLDDEAEQPTLDEVAIALAEPARPLFLGRKSCPPTRPLFIGLADAPSLLAALTRQPLAPDAPDRIRILLPEFEADEAHDERRAITDARNWRSGIHAGSRTVRMRSLDRSTFPDGAAS
jgi:CRISPR system Cascade subunit CasD